jgi:Fe-Mn family superoxide dismutase
MIMNRRELLSTLIVTSAAGSALSLEAQTPSPATSARQPKPLTFDPAKLNGLSEKLMRSHYDNNYSGAVKRLGQIEAQLASLPKDAPGFQLKGLKNEELIATNSIILHEEYFGILGGDGKASGTLQQAIARQFGSFDLWDQNFRAVAGALGGGSGWAILSFNFNDGKLHTYSAFDHTDNVAFGRPILVADMFEHAYQMDFGAAAAKYVDAFMQNVKWEECSRRYDEAVKIYGSLKH